MAPKQKRSADDEWQADTNRSYASAGLVREINDPSYLGQPKLGGVDYGGAFEPRVGGDPVLRNPGRFGPVDMGTLDFDYENNQIPMKFLGTPWFQLDPVTGRKIDNLTPMLKERAETARSNRAWAQSGRDARDAERGEWNKWVDETYKKMRKKYSDDPDSSRRLAYIRRSLDDDTNELLNRLSQSRLAPTPEMSAENTRRLDAILAGQTAPVYNRPPPPVQQQQAPMPQPAPAPVVSAPPPAPMAPPQAFQPPPPVPVGAYSSAPPIGGELQLRPIQAAVQNPVEPPRWR